MNHIEWSLCNTVALKDWEKLHGAYYAVVGDLNDPVVSLGVVHGMYH